MKNKLNYDIRPIEIDDYPKLIKWWKLYKKYGVEVPKKSLLPNKGLGGFVVEKDERLVASAFLYLTNSALGYVDYLIADPTYRENDRQNILLNLATYVTTVAVKLGCEKVWAMTANKKLVNMAEEAGVFEVLPDDYKMVYTYNKDLKI
mgnify:CR=1 FL=1